MANLREGKSSGKINNELSSQVSHSNLSRVHNKISSSKNTGTRGDEGCPELDNNMHEKEHVSNRANQGDPDAEAIVDGHAGVAADNWEEEI